MTGISGHGDLRSTSDVNDITTETAPSSSTTCVTTLGPHEAEEKLTTGPCTEEEWQIEEATIELSASDIEMVNAADVGATASTLGNLEAPELDPAPIDIRDRHEYTTFLVLVTHYITCFFFFL